MVLWMDSSYFLAFSWFKGCKVYYNISFLFLNQVRMSRRSAPAWFPEIVSSVNVGVCVCVCVPSPEGINNKWRERHA